MIGRNGGIYSEVPKISGITVYHVIVFSDKLWCFFQIMHVS